MVVPGRDDDPAGGDDLLRAMPHDLPELVVECLVHLVEQKDVGVNLVRNGEPEPRAHALGVTEHWTVEVLAKWDQTVAQWKAADPGTPVVPAIHLVTVVAQGAAGSDGMWRRRESPEMIGSRIPSTMKLSGL